MRASPDLGTGTREPSRTEPSRSTSRHHRGQTRWTWVSPTSQQRVQRCPSGPLFSPYRHVSHARLQLLERNLSVKPLAVAGDRSMDFSPTAPPATPPRSSSASTTNQPAQPQPARAPQPTQAMTCMPCMVVPPGGVALGPVTAGQRGYGVWGRRTEVAESGRVVIWFGSGSPGLPYTGGRIRNP